MSVLLDRLQEFLAGRYNVDRELGAGGMATVFLAQDHKHGRNVAIKVLRPELAAVIGAERFLREIQTIAALQHPHILGLIDSGEVNGTAYYVMPYVDGESLRDRLVREKQLPVSDAVRLAREVASALDYAHRHGVIHRDIKPENILLHEGTALVADFGIALAASNAGGSRMTETGMSLGTPTYMSPEQAMGERDITARSDVYALGTVTYEMLIGEPPFTGPTAQAIVAKVLTEGPPSLVARRRSIPTEIEDAVLTALEKLPADRFATAAEFAAALHAAPSRTSRERKDESRIVARNVGARRWLFPAIAALAIGVAYVLGTRQADRLAATLTFGNTIKVTWDPGLEVLPSISPDGKTVAYASGSPLRTRVMVRPVSGGRAIALTDDTTRVQAHPRWSPDGSRILFLEGGGVVSVAATGGVTRPEVPAPDAGPVMSADWSPDGKRIAYVVADSVFVREAGGERHGVASVSEAHGCSWSPDAATLACGSGNAIALMPGGLFGNRSPSRIVTVRLQDGRMIPVSDSMSSNVSPIWSADGRQLYYVSDRNGPRDIYMQPMAGNQPRGTTTRLTTGLGAHTIALSANGRRLVYASLESESNAWSVAVLSHTSASMGSATQSTHGSQLIETVTLSQDGRWLYYDSNLSGNSDLYRMALPDGAPERLTSDAADDFYPIASPDGREVAFHSWRRGSRDIWVMPLDGGAAELVAGSPAQEATAAWSPDGTRLAYSIFTDRGGIWIARRVNGRWGEPSERLDHGLFPVWSPDGRTLAFVSALKEGSIWVMPADSGVPRLVVDSTGPAGIRSNGIAWSRDGRNLYALVDRPDDVAYWAIPIDGQPARRVLVFHPSDPTPGRGGWDVRRELLIFAAIEHRSDIWVMEIGSE